MEVEVERGGGGGGGGGGGRGRERGGGGGGGEQIATHPPLACWDQEYLLRYPFSW